MRLRDKKIIITGGTRGIGKAIAIKMAQEGAKLAVTYVENDLTAKETVDEIKKFNTEAKAFQLNLQHLSTFQDFIVEVLDFLKDIDVLVNNAGIVTRNNFIDISVQEYDEILNTNLRGTYFLSQIVARYLKDQNKGGSIVNISSLSDQVVTYGLTHYQCSKAGLSMLTKGLALELAQYGIRVNTIAPGLVATDINKIHWENASDLWLKRASEIPLGRVGIPEDIAGAAVLFASDEAKWITGAHLNIDGGRAII